MVRFFRTPAFFKYLLPEAIWHGDRSQRKIYLTFDDGPVPEVTEYVLDLLAEWDIKATFFCVGENVRRHPALLQRTVAEGHAIGNHTYHHLNGWRVSSEKYLDDITICEDIINGTIGDARPRLFRPPYGKISPSGFKKIKKDFKVIMWDVLSYDFSRHVTPEQSLQQIMKHTRNGSIIIFHDSMKTLPAIKLVISQYVGFCMDQNYEFCTLKEI